MASDRPFSITVRVYYEDTDFSGVVYHARYLHFFERGRTEALRSCGVTHTDLLARDEPLALAVRKMTTEWIAPARIDDELEILTEFVEVKGARMALVQTMMRGADVIARAEVDAVCMNLSASLLQ
jgi:acyl-CoA thioester hydrolase